MEIVLLFSLTPGHTASVKDDEALGKSSSNVLHIFQVSCCVTVQDVRDGGCTCAT